MSRLDWAAEFNPTTVVVFTGEAPLAAVCTGVIELEQVTTADDPETELDMTLVLLSEVLKLLLTLRLFPELVTTVVLVGVFVTVTVPVV